MTKFKIIESVDNQKTPISMLSFSPRATRVVSAADSIISNGYQLGSLQTNADWSLVARDMPKWVIDLCISPIVWKICPNLGSYYHHKRWRTLWFTDHRSKRRGWQMHIRCALLVTFGIEREEWSTILQNNVVRYEDALVPIGGDESGPGAGNMKIGRKTTPNLQEETLISVYHVQLAHIRWGRLLEELMPSCPETNQKIAKQIKIWCSQISVITRGLELNS